VAREGQGSAPLSRDNQVVSTSVLFGCRRRHRAPPLAPECWANEKSSAACGTAAGSWAGPAQGVLPGPARPALLAPSLASIVGPLTSRRRPESAASGAACVRLRPAMQATVSAVSRRIAASSSRHPPCQCCRGAAPSRSAPSRAPAAARSARSAAGPRGASQARASREGRWRRADRRRACRLTRRQDGPSVSPSSRRAGAAAARRRADASAWHHDGGRGP
jgi:hypothetical protein